MAGLYQAGLHQAGLYQAGLYQAGLYQAGLYQAGLCWVAVCWAGVCWCRRSGLLQRKCDRDRKKRKRVANSHPFLWGRPEAPPRARRKPSALPKCISAQRLIPTGLTQFEMTSRLRVLRWSFCENSYPRPIPRSVVPQIETRTERSCHPQKSYFSKLIRSVCDLLDTSRLRGR